MIGRLPRPCLYLPFNQIFSISFLLPAAPFELFCGNSRKYPIDGLWIFVYYIREKEEEAFGRLLFI